MNIIKSIFKPRDKPKNHTGDSIGGGRSFPFGRTWSGKSVTDGRLCRQRQYMRVFVSYLKR